MSTAAAESVRLTSLVKAGGCASKLPPGSLAAVLSRLPRQTDPNVLVGFDTSDDAGVYRISATQAIVQTVDFFTPLVDDPFTFGRIAATNALSDVYAMGGQPITALALVCFPIEQDLAILEQIMRGGLQTMGEAGCAVVGGHSVRDPEIKFGYAVSGLIHPERIFTNTGARPGDQLLLTKPLGTGVITTALKQGRAEAEWVQAAVHSMTTLNRVAAEVCRANDSGVHAVTDVTGFGLIGHARELAIGSDVVLQVNVNAIPILKGSLEAIRMGAIPGGLLTNRSFAECVVKTIAAPPKEIETLLYDPQTAGGLLISVAADEAGWLEKKLNAAGVSAVNIGHVLARKSEHAGYIQLV